MQIPLFLVRKQGTEMTVRCDPEDPEKLDNVYDLYTYIIFDVIFAVLTVLDIVLESKAKKKRLK